MWESYASMVNHWTSTLTRISSTLTKYDIDDIDHFETKNLTDNPSDSVSKLYHPSGVDVSYSTRHVEESWHHLMKSEDTAKFKQIAVCNFDFLLAAVSSNHSFVFIHSYFLLESNKFFITFSIPAIRNLFHLSRLFWCWLFQNKFISWKL